MSHVKDRQHRSRGGLEFSCITPKPKGIEGCVICQIKANILLYLLVGSNMEFLIYQEKYKIKSDFFTFIFCANTAHSIFDPQQYNFPYMSLTFISREVCLKFLI